MQPPDSRVSIPETDFANSGIKRFEIVDLRLQIDERHKEESTELFITIPVGASFACDRRISELRDCGFGN